MEVHVHRLGIPPLVVDECGGVEEQERPACGEPEEAPPQRPVQQAARDAPGQGHEEHRREIVEEPRAEDPAAPPLGVRRVQEQGGQRRDPERPQPPGDRAGPTPREDEGRDREAEVRRVDEQAHWHGDCEIDRSERPEHGSHRPGGRERLYPISGNLQADDIPELPEHDHDRYNLRAHDSGGRSGDADGGVFVGLEHLLHVALRDDVAHRRAPVAGHHDTGAVGDRDDCRPVRRVDGPIARHAPANSTNPPVHIWIWKCPRVIWAPQASASPASQPGRPVAP